MLSIFDEHTIPQNLPSDLRALIDGHLVTAKESGLLGMTNFAVIQPHGTEEAGLGLAENAPNWDWLEVHPGWYELGYIIGDKGFAVILFVPN